jgi:hypothetical protein
MGKCLHLNHSFRPKRKCSPRKNSGRSHF